MAHAHSSARNTPWRRAKHRPGEVAQAVAGLPALDTKALKQQWQILWGAEPPPGLSRLLLLRAIAYRLQERALGGLKPATRRLLRDAVTDAATEPTRPARPSRAMQPGTVLVREWHGTSHRVTLLDHGCSWRDRRYRSLSEVAREITGSRWSGPRFFGLGPAREARRHGTA